MTNPAPTSFYSNTITSGFQAVYLGPFATAPTTDNFGNPLQAGQLYFNTISNLLNVYTGVGWVTVPTSVSTNTWTFPQSFTSAAPQITLGANGGNSGQITLNGSTSGTTQLFVNSTGQLGITAASGQSFLLAQGGLSASLSFAGGTSGSVVLSTPLTGGVLQVNGSLATNTGGFQTLSGSGTVTSGLVLVTAAATLTLPAGNTGQHLWIKMAAAVATVVSASSNVVPLNSTTAGTAIFSSGNLTKFVHLVFDGTNWQMVEGA